MSILYISNIAKTWILPERNCRAWLCIAWFIQRTYLERKTNIDARNATFIDIYVPYCFPAFFVYPVPFIRLAAGSNRNLLKPRTSPPRAQSTRPRDIKVCALYATIYIYFDLVKLPELSSTCPLYCERIRAFSTAFSFAPKPGVSPGRRYSAGLQSVYARTRPERRSSRPIAACRGPRSIPDRSTERVDRYIGNGGGSLASRHTLRVHGIKSAPVAHTLAIRLPSSYRAA